jgi:hypothetical protein
MNRSKRKWKEKCITSGHLEIQNLKAEMTGRNLNYYQKALARNEFKKLLDYVEKLETIKKYLEENIASADRYIVELLTDLQEWIDSGENK